MTEFIRVVQRTMRILSSFDHDHPEMGVAELSRKLDLPKPTVYRILATLESGGFVQQSPNGKYHLGFQLVQLGWLALDQVSLRREALPFMRELLEGYRETVSLTVFDGGSMFYLDVLESPQPVKIAAQAGRRLSVHCTASGRAVLAYISEERVMRVLGTQGLRAHTSETITDLAALKEELRLTRERGYSISQGEFEEGISAVGAPVMGSEGQVLAVIAVAGPTYRLPAERIAELGKAVQRKAHELSDHLSGARLT